MQTEKNKEIIRRFNQEFIQNGDESVADALIHPNFINRTIPAGAAGGDKAGTIGFIHAMKQAFPDLTVEILMQVAEGDLVTTHKAFHGTHMGTYMGIEPTGKKVSFRIIDILRIQDGMAIEHWSVRDSMALYQQITA